MRSLQLKAFGDWQAFIDALSTAAFSGIGTHGTLGLGAFVHPPVRRRRGIRDWFRDVRTRQRFEAVVANYCLRFLSDASPDVLLIVLDATRIPATRADVGFAAARAIGSECVAVASMVAGTDTTVIAVVVRSEDDIDALIRPITRGGFDRLAIGGLTVLDAARLKTERPSGVQADDLV